MLMKMDAVLDGRLTADSAEQERYELLKNETLTLARPDESKLADIDLADFNTRKKSAVMPGMKALAKKLGIMNVDLQNSRIEIPFQFSNRGLATSLHHQLEYGGSYQDYAKMMTCFNELIRNAVLIEIHGEKKAGTSKENPDLKRVYVLLGGVKPRYWGKVLGKFVYENLAGTELCTFDENGNEQTVYLARENDRVRKDGANNSHRVIDKLARYKGDNTKVLAVVHISELLATSEHEKNTDEHNHQWMDSRGWEYRKTYVQDTAGNIYSATLNIARGNDRNILYDINNVRRIDEGSIAGGVVSSARRSGRDSLTSHNASSHGNVSQRAENVKRENENLTTIRNLNEDDLEALYGSARIPVQELLTNTEGAGDVSLIVKNEDARNNNAHLENMAAVIPSSVDWWLVEKLKMNGLNVVEYKAGNEQARQEAEAKASLYRVPQIFS